MFCTRSSSGDGITRRKKNKHNIKEDSRSYAKHNCMSTYFVIIDNKFLGLSAASIIANQSEKVFVSNW